MTRGVAAALVAFACLGAAVPAWGKARIFHLGAGEARVRVVVPAAFASLLPDSVYPNRRQPKVPRGTPVAIVEEELAGRAEPLLLARGFIVAEVRHVDSAAIDAVLAGLRGKIDGSIGETKILARDPGNALENSHVRAAALFEPPSFRAPDTAPINCLPIALFRRTPDGEPSRAPASERPDCVSERWYRAAKRLPAEAFRDAAEWLATTSASEA